MVREGFIIFGFLTDLNIDDLLGELIQTVETKVENDYVIIYTSSEAKVNN